MRSIEPGEGLVTDALTNRPLTRPAFATLGGPPSPRFAGRGKARKNNGLRTFRRTAPAERLGRAADHAALRFRNAQEIHGRSGRLEPRHVAALRGARPHRAAVRRGTWRYWRWAGRDH